MKFFQWLRYKWMHRKWQKAYAKWSMEMCRDRHAFMDNLEFYHMFEATEPKWPIGVSQDLPAIDHSAQQ